jgi:hypothetical protein
MLNFIPTPYAMMNELFREPTKHDHLQDVIPMFTLHIHPTTTQKTYQHCDKVNTWTSKEISNSHIVLFVIWKNTIIRPYPGEGTSTIGKTVHWVSKMPTSQLLVCYYVILKIEGCFTFLPPQSCGPTICIGWLHNVVNIHSSDMQNVWTKQLGTK